MEEPTPQNWRRFTKIRPDRKLVRRRARKIESATLKHAHTFVIRRWDNVKNVRRFALAWLVLMGLLIGISGLQMLMYRDSFSVLAKSDGGTYAEGTVGPLETINPLFATTSAERSASKLVFSGLLDYDRDNQLSGELAESWRIENDGKRYVVDLRNDVVWHDGVSLTVNDVMFTVERMKNPLTRSSLYSSWTNVSVEKISDTSVAFNLPAAYAPFPHALTFGILPKHLLNDISPEALRGDPFNREPVGTGPFAFNRLQLINPDQGRVVVYLSANKQYIKGAPKLDRFQLHVYNNPEQVRRAFITREVNAAVDLTSSDVTFIKNERPEINTQSASLHNGTYAFFKTDSPLLTDVKIREALRLATNRPAVIEKLGGYGKLLQGPLLTDHFSSLAGKRQPSYDLDAAKKKLDEAGWILKDGVRTKDGKPLRLTVVSLKTGDYPTVLETVAVQWKALGIEVVTEQVAPESIQQNVILPRAYDVLIYELALGVDPDVYAYWHSSQAGPRGLNLSNYKSDVADDTLLSAQSRSEKTLRQPKYEAFVDAWLKDVPAVALYQPSLHYVTTQASQSLASNDIVADAASRYRSIELWTIESAMTFRTP